MEEETSELETTRTYTLFMKPEYCDRNRRNNFKQFINGGLMNNIGYIEKKEQLRNNHIDSGPLETMLKQELITREKTA